MMVDSLSSSFAELRLKADQFTAADFDAQLVEQENNPPTEQIRLRKRARKSVDEIKSELENEFLTPSPTFSPDWLNRLQR
jgi:antiviral helicase SKI2